MAPDQLTHNEAGCHSEAKIEAGGNESYGQPHSHHRCPCKIMDLKMTKVQHQLPHQCHQGPTYLEVPGIHAATDGPIGNLETI